MCMMTIAAKSYGFKLFYATSVWRLLHIHLTFSPIKTQNVTKKKEHKNCTPEQLYLKMLEIGSECISCGTNFTKIKLELSKCGLISEKDDEKTLKILFENSFEDDLKLEVAKCDRKMGRKEDVQSLITTMIQLKKLSNCTTNN